MAKPGQADAARRRRKVIGRRRSRRRKVGEGQGGGR